MATIEELGNGLKERLVTIATLRSVEWLPPDQINAPMAVIVPSTIQFHARSGDGQHVTFDVTLYIAPAQAGSMRGAEKVLPYLEKSGAQSVKAAIEADTTLGGKASSVPRITWHNFDALKAYNGAEYWGAIFEVEVRD